MGSFSMLRYCITNLHTVQHGYLGYLGALHTTSGLNDTSCSDKFLDFENDKNRKRMSDFRLTFIKAVGKHSLSFPFPDVGQCPCLCRHSYSTNLYHFTLTGRPLRESSSRLSLPSRKRLCHLNISVLLTL